MFASRWWLLLVYPHAVKTTECLVGCLVQGISPFDDDNVVVWDDRGTCDPATLGCEVSTVTYPGYRFEGALWASTSGTEGSSDCTCSICDPYMRGDTTSYMSEETSLWARIHCFLAASEASGYDVSPCVGAIVDRGTLPCVDDVYEPPTVGQFDCDENDLRDISASTVEECIWDGDLRKVQEMFPATPVSSSTTATGTVVNTNSCLVGCLVQGISPFDSENLAIWDNRGTCDPTTLGCEVSTITYPGYIFQGALWASSWGTEGSSSCKCSICDPYLRGDTTSYMSEETLWSRIHCYLVATEASGYDVSPCVAAIVDTGTLPCVDDVYQTPTVGRFDCEANALRDLSDPDSVQECILDGVHRLTDELYGGTRGPSPLLGLTAVPVPISSDTNVLVNPTHVPVNTRIVTPQPSTTSADSPNPPPTPPSVTSMPSSTGAQPGITRTSVPQQGVTSTYFPNPTVAAPVKPSPPSADGSTPPLEIEGNGSCSTGTTCKDDLCCHPATNTCGRKHTYCQERDFLDGSRCCSGVEGDPSASNVCSEGPTILSTTTNESEGMFVWSRAPPPPAAELFWSAQPRRCCFGVDDEPSASNLCSEGVAGKLIEIFTGIMSIMVAIWKGYAWCKETEGYIPK